MHINTTLALHRADYGYFRNKGMQIKLKNVQNGAISFLI